MEFFSNTSFDLMRLRRVFLGLSLAAVVLSLGMIVTREPNLGIDFAGGTQMIVRFAETPDVQELRGMLEEAGVENASIQTYGSGEENSVILKTPTADDADLGSAPLVERVLDQRYNQGVTGFDLNRQGTEALASLLMEEDPDDLRASGDDITARERYRAAAAVVMQVRRNDGLITDWSGIRAGEALSEASLAAIRERAALGRFAVLSSDNVLPQIGGELRRKGLLAIVFSLTGIPGVHLVPIRTALRHRRSGCAGPRCRDLPRAVHACRLRVQSDDGRRVSDRDRLLRQRLGRRVRPGPRKPAPEPP